MFAFIVRRLLWLPLLLFLVSITTFALGLYGPGDPVQVMLGLHTRPDIVERVRHELGLDQPFYIQYLNYVGNALRGNFGYSLVRYEGQAVGDLIAKRLPVTIQLNLISIAWSVPLGIVLGITAGVNRNTTIDLFARALVIAGISLPIIALLPVLTFVFSRQHEFGAVEVGPFLPVGGWGGILVVNQDAFAAVDAFAVNVLNLPARIFASENIGRRIIEWLLFVGLGQFPLTISDKIVLPALIEGLGPLAVFTRQTRAGMIEALGEDYVRTARAKGLTEQLVVYRHALRNALIPLATIVGFLLAGLLEGSFLVENWYGIPGIGQLAFDALFSRDYYVIMAVTLMGAAGYALANLAIDVAYAYINPQIRYGQ